MILAALLLVLALPQERRPVSEPPGDALRVAGRVVLPAGTPEDEALVVVARSSARFERPQGEDPREWRSEVDGEGRFVAVFAPGSTRGWVALEGRYVVLERRARVALEPLPEELVLRPTLGGRLRVELVAPKDRLGSGEAFAEAGAFASEGFERSAGRYRIALDGAGVGEVGPLRPWPRYELLVEVPGFVQMEREGVTIEAGALRELELRLVPEVRLEGRVVDPEGAPVAGARLYASVEGEGPGGDASGVTDEAGSFALGGLRAGGTTLWTRAAGFLPQSSVLTGLAPGERRGGLVIALERGLTIAGSVRHADGRPAAGATLKALPESTAHDRSTQGADADAQGRFELIGLRPGAHTLEALAADEPAAARREGVAAGARGVELVLQRSGTLVGVVLDELGAPVRAFTLLAEPAPGTPGEARRVEVEHPAGRFELDGLEPGTWRLGAQVEGCATLGSPRVELPGQAAPVELRVMRLATLRGVVREPSGAPAPRARVALRADPRSRVYTQGAGKTEARADDEGRFELTGAPPGAWFVVADTRGHAASEPESVSIASGEAREGLELVLRRSARVVGELHPSLPERAGRTVLALAGDLQGALAAPRLTTRTDRAGRFELEGVTPGRYELGLLTADMSGLEHSIELELAAGEELRVVLGGPSPEAVLLSGRVLDGDGPRADVRLDFQRLGGWSQPRSIPAQSGVGGRYELTLDRPGDYLVSLSDAGGELGELELEVPTSARAERDLFLERGAIEGVLRDESGAALAGLIVQLEREDAPQRAVTSAGFASLALRSEVSDAEGRFAFEHLPAGRYTLRAGAQLGRKAPPESAQVALRSLFGLALEDGQRLGPLELTLPRAATIAGRVLAADGSPPPAAEVQLVDEQGRPLTTRPTAADPIGRFRIERVAPGPVRLRARQGEAVGPWRELDLRAGATAELTLRLGR